MTNESNTIHQNGCDSDDSSCFAHVAAKITIKNLCSYDVTACDKESLTDRVTCYVLNGGGNSQVEIDVGAWQGLIWGLPSSFGDGGLGYQALSQADLAEFTIGMSPPDTQRDYYAISNVVSFTPTNACASLRRLPVNLS